MTFEQISEILKERSRDKNLVFKGADMITGGGGFTQVPNFVLVNKNLSVGAKLTYAMLLRYAWHNDFCYPGQDKLSEDMAAGKRSIVRWIKELEEIGFLKIKRQGLGKTNIYELNFITIKKSKK